MNNSLVYSLNVLGNLGGGKGILVSIGFHPTLTSQVLTVCTSEERMKENEKKECNESESVYVVRRIIPLEAERLQGFPDGYTDIPWSKSKNGHAPDSHRYKALGNSFAVPVVRWIGTRIVEALENPITEDTSEPIEYQLELDMEGL